MKKAFISLVALLLVSVFTSLLFFIFEIKALKSENTKNEYLYTQGKLYLKSLENILKKLNHKEFKELSHEQKQFNLKIVKTKEYFECYVWHNTKNVRLFKRIKQ